MLRTSDAEKFPFDKLAQQVAEKQPRFRRTTNGIGGQPKQEVRAIAIDFFFFRQQRGGNATALTGFGQTIQNRLVMRNVPKRQDRIAFVGDKLQLLGEKRAATSVLGQKRPVAYPDTGTTPAAPGARC